MMFANISKLPFANAKCLPFADNIYCRLSTSIDIASPRVLFSSCMRASESCVHTAAWWKVCRVYQRAMTRQHTHARPTAVTRCDTFGPRQECASSSFRFGRKAVCLFAANYDARKIHAIVALREVLHLCVMSLCSNLYPSSRHQYQTKSTWKNIVQSMCLCVCVCVGMCVCVWVDVLLFMLYTEFACCVFAMFDVREVEPLPQQYWMFADQTIQFLHTAMLNSHTNARTRGLRNRYMDAPTNTINLEFQSEWGNPIVESF